MIQKEQKTNVHKIPITATKVVTKEKRKRKDSNRDREKMNERI